jgi:hypothetical protein
LIVAFASARPSGSLSIASSSTEWTVSFSLSVFLPFSFERPLADSLDPGKSPQGVNLTVPSKVHETKKG